MNLITGLLLAAGASRRFGGDKLLKPLPDGDCVAACACENLLAGVDRVLAVVRPDADVLAKNLLRKGAEVVVFAGAAEGMGASLACAVRSSPVESDGWLVALADMPWIMPATIKSVASAIRQGAELATPVYRGQRGHPVGFSRAYRAALSILGGDSGAKSVILSHGDRLCLIEVDDPGVLRDIDLPSDLE